MVLVAYISSADINIAKQRTEKNKTLYQTAFI